MGSLGLENELQVRMNVESISGGGSGNGSYLHKYRLYETRSNFYMIGWNKNRTCWKVLKINRLEQFEFSIVEDPATYSEIECCDLLNRIHEGNKSTGGLKFVTTCYGIVGLIKLLGPYYMLLITKRRKIGTICSHAVYAIAKSEMIPIPNSTVQSNMAISKNENRYKKLLHTMDLTKGFFFSYSYHVMLSLQKNLRNHETGSNLYDTLFVWNEFLTRGIRNQLKNSVWTVALAYGFFKQVKLSVSGRDFNLILIARRSRHYAGTRYLKRGVNKKGRVANDVETEQIVFEDVTEGCPLQISSVVQNRGSIPLFWSQEISRLNIKPDIILSKEDHKYKATKLHFENLVKRYGNPIIVLDLIKMREKKPRESILRAEFAKALELINKDLAHGNRLKFLHWDMSKHSRNNAASALAYLVKVATNSLDLTGFFYCQLLPSSSQVQCSNNYGDCADVDVHNMTNVDETHFVKPALFQKGVLRTNCIDCLDRTNIAQYAYGLVALGHQLRALGYVDVSTINLDSQLADDLMKIYEAMGDTLALQYGGSAAHHKIFSEIRGQWKAATQSQEFLKSIHRFYNNAYMDAEKQDAINVFLGHFQPQQGKPALWELDSDQHYHVGRRDSDFSEENSRLYIKRSLSVGDINFDSDSAIDDANVLQMDNIRKPLPVNIPGYDANLTESVPETCDCVISSFRYTPSLSRTQLLPDTEPAQHLDNDKIHVVEHRDSFNYSNFLGTDRLSSSGNSWEEDTYESLLLVPSAPSGSSSGEMKEEAGLANESGSSLKVKEPAGKDLCCGAPCCCENPNGFSKQFVHWVAYDDLFSLDVTEIRAS